MPGHLPWCRRWCAGACSGSGPTRLRPCSTARCWQRLQPPAPESPPHPATRTGTGEDAPGTEGVRARTQAFARVSHCALAIGRECEKREAHAHAPDRRRVTRVVGAGLAPASTNTLMLFRSRENSKTATRRPVEAQCFDAVFATAALSSGLGLGCTHGHGHGVQSGAHIHTTHTRTHTPGDDTKHCTHHGEDGGALMRCLGKGGGWGGGLFRGGGGSVHTPHVTSAVWKSSFIEALILERW
jgi:hypothetical protein